MAGRRSGPVLVTGGAGFIGSHVAQKLLRQGHDVRLLDNLERPGSELRLASMREAFKTSQLEVVQGDVRDAREVMQAAKDVSCILHLAGQVAVTRSLIDPVHDFEVNARGTLNVLEAARSQSGEVAVLLASTNKVYGGLEDISLRTLRQAYTPTDAALEAGIDESRPVTPISPYACSKAAADQYLADYHRCFGVPTIALRMSCIYGPEQSGTEHQGWVSHFVATHAANRTLTIYGDGMQVRDLLHVEDCAEIWVKAAGAGHALAGTAINVGGGLDNAVSILDLIDFLDEQFDRPLKREFQDWRAGDQKWFVANTARCRAVLEHSPTIGWREGVAEMVKLARSALRT